MDAHDHNLYFSNYLAFLNRPGSVYAFVVESSASALRPALDLPRFAPFLRRHLAATRCETCRAALFVARKLG